MTETATIVQTLSDLKHRTFPRPFERLAVHGHRLVGAEIGVYKGQHARSLLAALDIKQLYLIDPYESYPGYLDATLHYGIDQDSLETAEQQARQTLDGDATRITWLRMRSDVAAKRFKPASLDFVYIDGNHEEAAVTRDLVLYYPLVKPGGILGGHDYYNGFCREHDGVVNAVTRFVLNRGLQLQVELPDWWVVK